MSNDSGDDGESDDDVQPFNDEQSEDDDLDQDYDEDKGLGTYDSDGDLSVAEDSKKINLTAIEHQVSAAIRIRREAKEQQEAAQGVEYGDVDEQLGDNFEDTPWVAPTLEIAWEWHLKNIYRGGKTALRAIKLVTATDIGLGLPLYFLFVRTVAIVMFVMSLLSLPALVFSYFGHRIPTEERDILGLYRLTIGNIGHDPDSKAYESDSACTGAEHLTCVKVLSQEFSLQAVANIIALCEVLQVLVFLLGVRFLRMRSRACRGNVGDRLCCVSDYAVMVENIPPDTTVEQLVEHFSGLYFLHERDWRGRPVLEEAEAVQIIHNTGSSIYKNTWVAEATIFSKIGSMIKAFKDKKRLMDNLLRFRAQMKMYGEGTCHAGGPNERRFRRAEKSMLAAATKVDTTTAAALTRARVSPDSSQYSASMSQVQGLQADALVSFVVFNYSESMARCVDDYTSYNSFPMNFCMPRQLMFRGRRIKVTQASEPDDIVWENLEISAVTKTWRRLLTALSALVLIVIGFAIVLQAAQYKKKFDDDIPQLSMCETEIPALYQNSYDVNGGVKIVRPSFSADSLGMTRKDYDLACSEYHQNSFYAVYTTDGNIKRPLANYSILDGCVPDEHCPLAGQSFFCPCLSAASGDMCDTLQCSIDNNSSACTEFKSSTIADCYCYELLLDMFSSSFMGFLDVLRSADGHCQDFLTNYTLAFSLMLLASICTVALNFMLTAIMKFLAKKEYHCTMAAERRAVVVSVFATSYVNMALVVWLAFGYVHNKPAMMESASILDGKYADFSPFWYSQVGSYLVVTFILQACTPLIIASFKYYIYSPCRMCFAHPKISNQTAHKFPVQSDVNALELGDTFDFTVHTAQLLALGFLAMTYGTGLPIMHVLCWFTFVLYFRSDKFLLLRYHQKPSKTNDAVMKTVLAILPWACVIRLGFACWMLSNKVIFPDSKLLIDVVPSVSSVNTGHISNIYNNWVERQAAGKEMFGVSSGTRIPRGHVFPLFALLVLIVIVIIMQNFLHSQLKHLGKVFLGWWKCLKSLRKKHSTGMVKGFDLVLTGDPLRSEMAPFTGDYFQYHHSEVQKGQTRCCKRCRVWNKYLRDDLSQEEVQAGWRMSFKGPHKVKISQWAETTSIMGINRPKGSVRRTYEVVASHGCYSYTLKSIPHYKKILLAIQEAVSSLGGVYDEERGLEGSRPLSIVGEYRKRHETKKLQAMEAAEKNEALWSSKPTAKNLKHIKHSSVVPEEKDAAHVSVFGKSNQSDSSSDSD